MNSCPVWYILYGHGFIRTFFKEEYGMSTFVKYLCVIGIAALPVLELRAAIPFGVMSGLPLSVVLPLSILGNMLPTPIILFFIERVFRWMKKRDSWLSRAAIKLENHALRKRETIERYELLGLFALVAIPLPGTGAWTGALAAAVMKLEKRKALPVIFLGTVAAGIIMSIIMYGANALFGA